MMGEPKIAGYKLYTLFNLNVSSKYERFYYKIDTRLNWLWTFSQDLKMLLPGQLKPISNPFFFKCVVLLHCESPVVNSNLNVQVTMNYGIK
jgi:hypothetical protein